MVVTLTSLQRIGHLSTQRSTFCGCLIISSWLIRVNPFCQEHHLAPAGRFLVQPVWRPSVHFTVTTSVIPALSAVMQRLVGSGHWRQVLVSVMSNLTSGILRVYEYCVIWCSFCKNFTILYWSLMCVNYHICGIASFVLWKRQHSPNILLNIIPLTYY